MWHVWHLVFYLAYVSKKICQTKLWTLQGLVSISEVRECVFTNPPKFSDFNGPTNTCVYKIHNLHLILYIPSINASRNPMTARFLSIQAIQKLCKTFPIIGKLHFQWGIQPLQWGALIKPERHNFPFLMALIEL